MNDSVVIYETSASSQSYDVRPGEYIAAEVMTVDDLPRIPSQFWTWSNGHIELQSISPNTMDRVLKVFESVTGRLDRFEHEFGMSSEDFMRGFEDGSLPEQPDFFEWQIAYTGYENLVRRFGLTR